MIDNRGGSISVDGHMGSIEATLIASSRERKNTYIKHTACGDVHKPEIYCYLDSKAVKNDSIRGSYRSCSEK
jgi:hypothetical protein